MPPKARLAWLWTMVILVLCWFPREYMGINERGPRPFFVPNFDKLVHLGLFAGFSFLWMRVGSSKLRAFGIFLSGLALAVLTEVVQTSKFVNRDGSVGDGLADLIGVFVGLVAYAVASRYQGKRATSRP